MSYRAAAIIAGLGFTLGGGAWAQTTGGGQTGASSSVSAGATSAARVSQPPANSAMRQAMGSAGGAVSATNGAGASATNAMTLSSRRSGDPDMDLGAATAMAGGAQQDAAMSTRITATGVTQRQSGRDQPQR